MKINIYSRWLIFSLLILLLVGCNGSQQTTQSGVTPLPGYPSPRAVVNGYPASGQPNSKTTEQKPSQINPNAQLPSAPAPKDAEPGKGSISGVLYSTTNKGPIPKTMFYLIKGAGNGEEIPPVITGPSKNDTLYSTDEVGAFSINNIPPGKYFIVMSAPPYDWAIGYKDTKPTPLLVDIQAGKKTNYGAIFIFWP